MQEINIEEIMQEIRDEVKAKGMKDQKLQFADVSLAEDAFELPEKYDSFMMEKELLNLNGLWDTSLQEIRSASKLKKAVKKALKKAIGLIINPHIAQQTAFNASVVHSINMLNCLEKENEELRAQVEDLKRQIDRINEKIGQDKTNCQEGL